MTLLSALLTGSPSIVQNAVCHVMEVANLLSSDWTTTES